MKIFLIRHGLTITNKEKIFSTDDAPLAEEAYPELDKLKEKLNGFSFDEIYASPFKRALQTANYLGFKNIIKEARLQEYNFGLFKGLTFLQAEKKYPKEAAEWINNSENVAPPQGETGFDHFLRVSDFLNELAAKDGNFLLVTHYGTIAMAMAWALEDFSKWNKFGPKNSSISILEVKAGSKTINAFNI